MDGRKLRITGLTDKTSLRDMFERYGPIEQILVFREKEFSLVTFAHKGSADSALANVALIKSMVPIKGFEIRLEVPEKTNRYILLNDWWMFN